MLNQSECNVALSTTVDCQTITAINEAIHVLFLPNIDTSDNGIDHSLNNGPLIQLQTHPCRVHLGILVCCDEGGGFFLSLIRDQTTHEPVVRYTNTPATRVKRDGTHTVAKFKASVTRAQSKQLTRMLIANYELWGIYLPGKAISLLRPQIPITAFT